MLELTELLNLLSKIFFFLGYLSSSDSYPEKLSTSEEKDLIFLMQQGNEEAKNKLILHNLRLVAHIAKKYSTCPLETEDILSIGTIGLIKGINTFDSEKAPRLAGYIAKCIENEILMAIRSESKKNANVFLEDIIGSDEEGNNITLIDILPYEDDDIAYKLDLAEQTKKLNTLINTELPLREKTILRLRYGLNESGKKYTQIEVSELLDISRSYVSRLEKRALEKLSVYFTDEFF